jgi:hypothetical protein
MDLFKDGHMTSAIHVWVITSNGHCAPKRYYDIPLDRVVLGFQIPQHKSPSTGIPVGDEKNIIAWVVTPHDFSCPREFGLLKPFLLGYRRDSAAF